MIMPSIEQGVTLLHLARAAIARELGFISHDPKPEEWLQENGATFVTLTLHDRLRGCIGSLEAYRPLIEDVQNNAVAAAFRDPRFRPLNTEEFAEVEIEVSWLSAPEPVLFHDEADACAQLDPGQDGVILEYGGRRATYLPQVWAQLPEPLAFIRHLKEKAGLSEDFWSSDIRLLRYKTYNFYEAK
jgi:AmmeMemoRadiSam system protein A